MHNRFKSIATVVFCSLLAALLPACDSSPPEATLTVDILIRDGSVFSGIADEPLRKADVGISDDKIVFVGDAQAGDVAATKTLDANGLIVAPGFIDPHSHSMTELLSDSNSSNLNYVTQGVTTVFNGNDGDGPALLCDVLSDLRSRQFGTNTALFVGHGKVRMAIMGGENRAPSADELLEMSALVANAMQCGALGLSTGLYYVPGNFAATDEVIALAAVAAEYGGVYDTHLRDESSYNIGLLAAVEETLEIGRAAGIDVHISHIKALGVDVWGQSEQIIAMVEAAREAGLNVTANQYPWRASGTRLRNTLLPRDFLSGDSDAYMQRLADPAQVDAIKPAMAENLRRRGGAESLLIVDRNKPDIAGMTLEDIAVIWEQDPLDAAVDIMLSGSTRVASFNMNDEDIEAFASQAWTMTSSDGTDGHPRKYASFPKKYRDFVVNKPILSLPEFLYRSSGLTAETFGLSDRGRIMTGYAADIIAFDPERFAPLATFSKWDALSTGVEHSVINGKLVLEGGEFTGSLPGKVLTPDLEAAKE